jgi:hypothetical protein
MTDYPTQRENTFLRTVRYIIGPEVPWPYRMLLFLTIGLLIAGAEFEKHALVFQLIEKTDSVSLQAGVDRNNVQQADQEILNYRKKQYDRLVKGADMMFDFAKVAFGALVGGLSALISSRHKNANEKIIPQNTE